MKSLADPQPRPQSNTVPVRLLVGGVVGVLIGIICAKFATSWAPMPGGQNAAAGVFLGPAVFVFLSMTVGGSTAMGIIGALCRKTTAIVIATIVIVAWAIFQRGDFLAQRFTVGMISGLALATIAGVGIRHFVGRS